MREHEDALTCRGVKAKPARCPICKCEATAESGSLPFCSERCRKVDLGRWFNEGYTISRPIEQRDLEDEEV